LLPVLWFRSVLPIVPRAVAIGCAAGEAARSVALEAAGRRYGFDFDLDFDFGFALLA
jgi:hypothetical protein